MAERGDEVDLRTYLEISTAVPANFSPDGSKVLVQSNASGIASCTPLDATAASCNR